MSQSSLRKFEYQSVKPLNENRFEMINLPAISSKAKNAPNLVPEYARQPPGRKINLMDREELPDRNYAVSYTQTHEKPVSFNFRNKKHSEIAQATKSLLPEKKLTMMERLLKQVKDDEIAQVREMERRKREIEKEKQ